jgi:hypothetical protein
MSMYIWPQSKEILVQYEKRVGPGNYRIVQEALYSIENGGFKLVCIN